MEIQELRFEIEQARRNEQMTGSILQEQQARQELLARDKVNLDAQIAELKEEAETLAAQFAEKNDIFQNSNARILQVDEDLTTKRRELFTIGQVESSLDARVNSLSAQIAGMSRNAKDNERLVLNELREKQVEFESRRKKVINELDKERQMQLDLANDVSSFEANKKILMESASVKRAEVEEFKDQLNEAASCLYGSENLQNNFEGFQEGVKQVMRLAEDSHARDGWRMVRLFLTSTCFWRLSEVPAGIRSGDGSGFGFSFAKCCCSSDAAHCDGGRLSLERTKVWSLQL